MKNQHIVTPTNDKEQKAANMTLTFIGNNQYTDFGDNENWKAYNNLLNK